jgi:hypothetical protein
MNGLHWYSQTKSKKTVVFLYTIMFLQNMCIVIYTNRVLDKAQPQKRRMLCICWMLDMIASMNEQRFSQDIVSLEADTIMSDEKKSDEHKYVLCSQNERAASIRLPPPQPYDPRAHTTSIDVRYLERSKVHPADYPYRAKFKRAIGLVSHL